MKKRLELGLPIEASALADASTKDELLTEAQGAAIDGALSVTKDELAKAQAGAMT